MIKRFAGTVPTRSRAVAHDGVVYAVATAKNKSAPLYKQTKDAFAQIGEAYGERIHPWKLVDQGDADVFGVGPLHRVASSFFRRSDLPSWMPPPS